MGILIFSSTWTTSFRKISANALPDARILSDEHGRLLFLTVPAEDYDHGVLGDAIEATSITRFDDPLTGDCFSRSLYQMVW